jgi:RNA polymerase sigma factor for flagellar operon FliA
MYTAAGKSDKDYLVGEHAPLVKKLAHQMKAKLPPSVEVDDLIQAGMIGLLDAVNRYEETHGAQFETYAVQRIRGAMLDELRSSDWMPRSMRQNMRKIEVAMNALQQQSGARAERKRSGAPAQAVAGRLSGSVERWRRPPTGVLRGFPRQRRQRAFSRSLLHRRVADPLQNLMNTGFRSASFRSHRRVAGTGKNPDEPVLRTGNEPEGNRRSHGRHRVTRIATA